MILRKSLHNQKRYQDFAQKSVKFMLNNSINYSFKIELYKTELYIKILIDQLQQFFRQHYVFNVSTPDVSKSTSINISENWNI